MSYLQVAAIIIFVNFVLAPCFIWWLISTNRAAQRGER